MKLEVGKSYIPTKYSLTEEEFPEFVKEMKELQKNFNIKLIEVLYTFQTNLFDENGHINASFEPGKPFLILEKEPLSDRRFKSIVYKILQGDSSGYLACFQSDDEIKKYLDSLEDPMVLKMIVPTKIYPTYGLVDIEK